jgi:Archaeal/vacuolar-type H+-ATPase subunit I
MSKLSVLPDLKQLFDYYSIENAKLTASDSFAFTKTAFVLEGWIPKDEEPRVTDALRAISNAMVIETREPIAGDLVPTLTVNNKIVSPYEAVTNMFSPPNPLTDIDPNPFVAFFYFIMFGMMMGDAVYGIVLALGGFLCYHFMKPVPGKGKLFLIIGMGGISTIIWGTLFGSWMALPIENTFLSKLVWFNPVDESGAILMLVVSLAIGIFQILFSMGIKMCMLFKAGQWVDAICDQGTWFLILFGLGFYAGAPALGAPSFLKTVGLVMLFAGLGIVIVFGGRHKKGFEKNYGRVRPALRRREHFK